ncbi:MAG: hypothetical protein U0175_28090 [Caldilineaceae bacterium]
MSNPTHYRSGEFFVVIPILLALLFVLLLVWWARDFWRPIVVIVFSLVTCGILTNRAIRQWQMTKMSLLVLKSQAQNRQQKILFFVSGTCMAIAGVIWFQKAICSSPPDLMLLSQAAIDFTVVLGWAFSLTPSLQRSIMTANYIHSPIFLRPVHWTQIEGYTWQEKEVKGKKYLSLILYIQNWWKLPFFEHLKLKIIVQPDEKERVEELFHSKYSGKKPTL